MNFEKSQRHPDDIAFTFDISEILERQHTVSYKFLEAQDKSHVSSVSSNTFYGTRTFGR